MSDLTNAACLSDGFLNWVRRAGWVVSRFDDDGAFDDEGKCAVWQEDEAGQTGPCYLLQAQEDGWFTATEAPNGRPKALVLSSASLEVLERYLWGVLAEVIRGKSGLPALHAPAEAATGYQISQTSLVDPSGTAIAKAEAGVLVALSRYVAAKLEELEASFLSPDGKPLLQAG